MRPTGAHRVREFAELAGVTVRTLHFYDQKGVLRPARRTESTYASTGARMKLAAAAATMPVIAITTIASTSVKPR